MPRPKNPPEPGLGPNERRSQITGKVYRTGGSKKRNWKLEDLRRQRIDDNPPRCAWPSCNRMIPNPRRYKTGIKYCSEKCKYENNLERNRERQQLRRAVLREQLSDVDVLYDDSKIRRGTDYKKAKLQFTADEIEMWLNRDFTDAFMAKQLGITPQGAGYIRRAFHNDRILATQTDDWTIDPHHLELLGPTDPEMRKLLAEDPEKFELMLDELVDAFVRWRDEFFKSSPDATYITKPVHTRWIRSILKTIYTGGRTMILSPPRHGKTDLLIQFCDWLICRNPNIRILWVGPNGDIAENSLGDVKDTLENNEALRAAYLPEGQDWKPEGRSGMWTRSRFKVANRTIQRKQPTMWATGVGGKITSLDADFIIVDDPADPDDSQLPSGREKISIWFRMKLITRKMKHTGLAVISSRVHVEDLYSEILENDKWEILVDMAHDQAICGLDLFESHAHLGEHLPCILFSELNPLEYLRDQHDDVGPALFDMMYLNRPRPEGAAVFNIDEIREKCLDRSRAIGTAQIPGGYQAVGGLDPAARGIQATFAWAIDTKNDMDYMIDLETDKAGGIGGALRIMRLWHEEYELRIWVVEDNSYQKVFFDDPRVKALALELGLTILPTTTGANKHDPDFGVSSMAGRFHTGKVNLPYATTETRRKVELYLKQLAGFTGATGRSKRKSDILMASWFPFPDLVRKWRKSAPRRRAHDREQRSFEGFGYDDLSQAPWQTNYPG